MELSITVPDEKISALKTILVYENPEYEAMSNAQIKAAEESVLMDFYKNRIRAINRDKAITSAISSSDQEADVVFV